MLEILSIANTNSKGKGDKLMTAPVVTWSDSYNLGIPEIDEQHKSLFVIINKIWQGIVDRAPREDLLTLVNQLEMYTLAHFAAEEIFMRVTNYPGLEEHKDAHQKFVARVEAEKKAVLRGGILTFGLLNFLKDWLVEHIMGSDKAYAEFSRNMQTTAVDKANENLAQGESDEPLLRSIFKRFW
jgi:hemerythrin